MFFMTKKFSQPSFQVVMISGVRSPDVMIGAFFGEVCTTVAFSGMLFVFFLRDNCARYAAMLSSSDDEDDEADDGVVERGRGGYATGVLGGDGDQVDGVFGSSSPSR